MQTQQAGIILNESRDNSQINHVAFVKKNYSFKKIKQRLTEPNFKMALGMSFAEISALAGIKGNISDEHKRDIINMMSNVYCDLTLEEVYKAFELERHSVYDEKTEHFQAFNAEYISTILKKYKKWRQFTKIQHNIVPTQNIEPEKIISIEEQFEIMSNAIIRLYDEFLESGEISIPCTHVFDELYSRKYFPSDTEYQKKYAIAKFQLERELKAEKATNRQDKLKIQEVIQKLDSTNNEKVLSRAKQLVLKDYFTYLKSISTHIKELIQNA